MSPIEIPSIQLSTIAPELIVAVTAVVILSLDMLIPRVERINVTLITLIGLLVAIYSTRNLVDVNEPAFSWMILRDNVSVFLDLLFLKGTILIVLLSHHYAARHQLPYPEMMVLLLFATLGMMVVAISADLVTLFLGIELLSLCLYVLSGFDRRSLLSGEAGIKYFLLGAFSTGSPGIAGMPGGRLLEK